MKYGFHFSLSHQIKILTTFQVLLATTKHYKFLVLLKCLFFLEQVYNVTKFLDDHPGGDDVLLSSTGVYLIYIPFWRHSLELHVSK